MKREERNKDITNVSPHMDTIRGWRRDELMNGMPPAYWRGVLLFALELAALLGGLALLIGKLRF